MKIIVGLGNPGKKYSDTRHNVGFRVIETLAERYLIEREVSKFDGLIAQLRINNERVLLVKPLTFMNLSGKTVQSAVKFYKIDLVDLMIVCDDIDLMPGIIRIRPGGGTGGHKGLASIAAHLNSNDFPRMRIGIGRPPNDTIDWVLGRFSSGEAALMQETGMRAADALETWVKEGLDKAMNIYNKSVI
ncbi:MAG TPA: aminoacyl-tRNA hydrolase [Syntrophomonadaceae bacterium]|nr:aminoacyl-tRNA hydrolase [Syntrophomonadaceae bacterium]HPR93270.1 aminoacyl-tRNA hydrolase [Syntrophomonadaceae bacterium]